MAILLNFGHLGHLWSYLLNFYSKIEQEWPKWAKMAHFLTWPAQIRARTAQVANQNFCNTKNTILKTSHCRAISRARVIFDPFWPRTPITATVLGPKIQFACGARLVTLDSRLMGSGPVPGVSKSDIFPGARFPRV